MDEIVYPTWSDVGIPSTIVENIRLQSQNGLISYLLLNRVLRSKIKLQYVYHCRRCDYGYTTSKIFEEYAICSRCCQSSVYGSPQWVMGKDRKLTIDEALIPAIIQKMNENYSVFFKRQPPSGFMRIEFLVDNRKFVIPSQRPALGAYCDEEDEISVSAKFKVSFTSGEVVESNRQSLAIAKAAILCPFLWDDLFDWSSGTYRDPGHETHIIPLLNMWTRLGKDRFALPKKSDMPGQVVADVPYLPEVEDG